MKSELERVPSLIQLKWIELGSIGFLKQDDADPEQKKKGARLHKMTILFERTQAKCKWDSFIYYIIFSG